MTADKNVSISFRVSSRFKLLLEAAANREHRSQTNMLEMLLFAHCEQNRIEPPSLPEKAKRAKRKGDRK